MTGITRTLARYIASSRLDELPADVRHEGVRAFVNWLGCAAGGSQDEMVVRALELLQELDGAPTATIVGRREKLNALNATFINAMSSSALAFNDTHYITVAHPTGPAAAALLALSEKRPLSGKEFIHALILGIEIQCRIGNILCVAPAQSQIGLSMAGLVGGIGSAVAAGKALGLDEAGMATAIGHAANYASGLREAQGTMAGALTRGHAARDGLMAAMLAARGFTCSDTMIEGPKGFAVSYAVQPNFEVAVANLGKAFEISTLAYKPYPCGFVIHPIIDACLDVARSNALDPAQIERIELAVNPLAVQLTNRIDPKNPRQALLSLQHWAATSLIYKTAGVAQVAEAIVHDPAVCNLRRKVIASGVETVGREAANIRVFLYGNRHIEATVEQCRGSPGRPLTDDDLTEKTRSQLQTVYPAMRAEHILAECWRIEEYPRVDSLCEHLKT